MDLRYSHKAELLHSLPVAMVMPQRIIVSNMKLKYFHVVDFLQHSFVALAAVVTMATRWTSNAFCPKEHMCLIWT